MGLVHREPKHVRAIGLDEIHRSPSKRADNLHYIASERSRTLKAGDEVKCLSTVNLAAWLPLEESLGKCISVKFISDLGLVSARATGRPTVSVSG